MTAPTRPLTLAGLSVTSLSVTTDASDKALGNKRRKTVLMVGDVDDVLGEVLSLSSNAKGAKHTWAERRDFFFFSVSIWASDSNYWS
jgi:hypothetical protein